MTDTCIRQVDIICATFYLCLGMYIQACANCHGISNRCNASSCMSAFLHFCFSDLRSYFQQCTKHACGCAYSFDLFVSIVLLYVGCAARCVIAPLHFTLAIAVQAYSHRHSGKFTQSSVATVGTWQARSWGHPSLNLLQITAPSPLSFYWT